MTINYPDNGYSPDNFKMLVNATGMSNVDFIKHFSVTKPMFYRYRNGDVTMQHQDWKSLKILVESYVDKHPNNLLTDN